jgi:hypothetical protein
VSRWTGNFVPLGSAFLRASMYESGKSSLDLIYDPKDTNMNKENGGVIDFDAMVTS